MAQSKTKTWYAIETTAEEADVFIYDVIGAWGISADSFVKELRDVKASTINVHLNSPGGEVFQGFAIYNALKATKAKVISYVDGIAASIASVVALAGDEVRMAKNSFLMIHNPSTFAMGDAEELRKQAKVLDALSVKVADVYAEKTGETSAVMQARMNDETWYTAQEAKDAGLADAIVDEAAPDNAPVASIDTSTLIGNSRAIRHAIAFGLNQRSPADGTDGREIPTPPVRTKPSTEKPKMNGSQFVEFYNANPESPEVKAILAKGHAAGIAAGRQEVIAAVNAIAAVCPGKEKMVIDAINKGQDAETVKMIVTAIDTAAAASATALAVANAEIERLKSLGAVAKSVGRGPEPEKPGDTAVAIKACESIIDPATRAAAEWKSDPSLASQFTDEKNYVAYRKAELNGQIKQRGSR